MRYLDKQTHYSSGFEKLSEANRSYLLGVETALYFTQKAEAEKVPELSVMSQYYDSPIMKEAYRAAAK